MTGYLTKEDYETAIELLQKEAKEYYSHYSEAIVRLTKLQEEYKLFLQDNYGKSDCS